MPEQEDIPNMRPRNNHKSGWSVFLSDFLTAKVMNFRKEMDFYPLLTIYAI